MDITPLLPAHARPIRRYGPAGFTVGEEEYSSAILVTPAQVHVLEEADATAQAIRLATAEPGIELLLLGTGTSMAYVEEELREHLRRASIAHEIMDTGAACRTYNVLLAEGRRVAAMLLALS